MGVGTILAPLGAFRRASFPLLRPLCLPRAHGPRRLGARPFLDRLATLRRALGRVPFLNGGLFTRTPLERRHRTLRFTDDALGDVIGGLLGRYRLTAREDALERS